MRHRRVVLLKTLLFGGILTVTNVFGSYALKRGLGHVGILESWSPVPYIRAFANPWIAAGVLLMIGWLGSRLALLSWADLSYVLPLTSLSYVMTAAVGAIGLKESMSRIEWAGVCCITIGVVLVLVTYPKTTGPPEQAE